MISLTAAWALAALALQPAAAPSAGPAPVSASARRPAPAIRRLSDADLVRLAAAPFDRRAMMNRRIVLGRHHGLLVVADHPCGDVCPQYTRRIIHYDLAPERCVRAGGVVVEELVPMGIAVLRKPFCEPRVLARSESRK
ncbi:MAG TPA: hypothetical protein VF718_01430 [Allosphingosinicella sp.]|jgi:hypothetical protein